MRRIAYHSGTWIPLVIFGAMIATYLYARTEGLTWERPAVYFIGIVALLFGLRTLIGTLFEAEQTGEKARFYPLALAWTGVAMFVLFIGLLIAGIENLSGLTLVPEAVKFSCIVGGVVSIAVLSFVSYAGGKSEILAEPADPVPGRSLWKAWRRR